MGGRITVGMTLRPRRDRWDSANLTWIAGCKAGSQSGLPVSPRRERWDPTSIGKISNVGELTQGDVYKQQKEKQEGGLHRGTYAKKEEKS